MGTITSLIKYGAIAAIAGAIATYIAYSNVPEQHLTTKQRAYVENIDNTGAAVKAVTNGVGSYVKENVGEEAKELSNRVKQEYDKYSNK